MASGCTLGPFEGRIRAFAPLPKVTVDLTKASDLTDAALVALARALVAAGAMRVQLRRASQNQALLLQYCLGRTGQA